MKKFSITFFGTKWSIRFVDTIKSEDGNFRLGLTKLATNEIFISTKYEGKCLPKSTVFDTLLHELVHAIFQSGQYLNCCEDEPLVEWTAKCIREIVKNQNIIKFNK